MCINSNKLLPGHLGFLFRFKGLSKQCQLILFYVSEKITEQPCFEKLEFSILKRILISGNASFLPQQVTKFKQWFTLMYSKSEQTFPCMQSRDYLMQPVSNEAADYTDLPLLWVYMSGFWHRLKNSFSNLSNDSIIF